MEKLCECGCGEPTTLAKWTDARKSSVKGKPLRFLQGHGATVSRKNRTHCKNGHEFSPENTRIAKDMRGYSYRVCRTCCASSEDKFRKINPEKYRDENRSVPRKKKAQLVVYKGGFCTDCGGVFPACCFHFDHREPALKEFTIARAMFKAFDVLLPELDKCDLVCANCHAIRTFGNKDIREKLSKAKGTTNGKLF